MKALTVGESTQRHEAAVTANFLVSEPDLDRRTRCRDEDKFGHGLVTGWRRRNQRCFYWSRHPFPIALTVRTASLRIGLDGDDAAAAACETAQRKRFQMERAGEQTAPETTHRGAD